MADVATLSVLLTARDQASGVLKKVGQNAAQLGMSLVKLGAPLTALAALSLRTFAQFEKSMVRVQAVSNATAGEFAELTAVAKLMGRTTIFTATESAEALAFMAQAGLSAREAIGGLPSVLELAAAGGIELASAADLVTNVMAGMGLEIEDLARANDVLVTAFTSANTNLLQLGQAFKFAGPVAASAGLALEEVAAALALMGNAGIQATMAGTALRGAITRLLNPSKEAATILRRLGINAVDSSGELVSFRDIIEQLEDASISTADAMVLFGLRAGPGMLALISQGSDALNKLTREMENSGGTAERIAKAQMNTFIGSMARLKAVIEGTALVIGEQLAPIVRDLASQLEPVIDVVTRWVSRNPELTKGLIGASVALVGIGSALVVLGLILPGVITLVVELGIALGISTAGATLLLGAVAGLAIAYTTNFLKIRDITNAVAKFIFGVYSSWLGWFLPGGLLIKGFIFLARNWRETWDGITEVLENSLNKIRDILNPAIEFINKFSEALGIKAIPTMDRFAFKTDLVGNRIVRLAGEIEDLSGQVMLFVATVESAKALEKVLGGIIPSDIPTGTKKGGGGVGARVFDLSTEAGKLANLFARIAADARIRNAFTRLAEDAKIAAEDATKAALQSNQAIRDAEEAAMMARLENSTRINEVNHNNFQLELRRIKDLQQAREDALRGILAGPGGPVPSPFGDVRQANQAAQFRAGGGRAPAFDPAFSNPILPDSSRGGPSKEGDIFIVMDSKTVGEIQGARLKNAG